MALSWTMDKLGPMCRSATGCELVLGEIASATPAGIPPIEAEPDLDREDLHLAVIEGVGEEEQEGVRENYRESLSVLDDVASIETIALPDLPAGSVAGIVIDAEAAAAFDDLVDSGRTSELTAPADRVGGYSQRVVLAKDYINAMRVRAKIRARDGRALGAVRRRRCPYEELGREPDFGVVRRVLRPVRRPVDRKLR